MELQKKPIKIKAFRPFIDPTEGWFQQAMDEGKIVKVAGEDAFLIGTLEGIMRLNKGDWCILGVESEIYPCKDSVLRKSYIIPEGI